MNGGGNGRLAVQAPQRPAAAAGVAAPTVDVFDLVHSYREYGHLIANLDPLGHNLNTHHLLELSQHGFTEADLERVVESPTFKGCDRVKLRELIRILHATYCGTIGVEYTDIVDKAQRTWIEEHIEPTLNRPTLSKE